MPVSAKIREQIINSFRTELAEHVQTMNSGLLALEQGKLSGSQCEEILGNVFRAAHSLKGAARAVGLSAVEQLAHGLEDILGGIQAETLDLSSGLFTACYQAIDAIQIVQAAYEAGETTPPMQALQALSGLGPYQKQNKSAGKVTHAVEQVSTRPLPETSINPNPEGEPKSGHGIRNNHRDSLYNLDSLINDLKVEMNGERELNALQAKPELSEARKPAPVQLAELVDGDAGEFQNPIPPESVPTQTNQQPALDETIRVSVRKLDALMEQLSELLVTKIRVEQRMAQVRQIQAFMGAWQKEWLTARGEYNRLARHMPGGQVDLDVGAGFVKGVGQMLNYLDENQNRLREMSAMANQLTREYNSDSMQISLVIDGLEEEIKQIRMLPISTITASFGRMVRDLAQASGKEVVLEIDGGEVELDKRVLEQIKDPIIHLLRNAIDHGIETPQQRVKVGKPAAGTVTLSAESLGKDIAITISDDGAGLNINAIRQTAVRRGFTNVSTMSEMELAELIYNPGFSTSPIITDVSGRGVGLDVVRRNIESLHGRILVDWKANQGSHFTMVMPLTLTSSRALLVKVSNQLFAIPLNAIERIEQVKLDEIESMGGHDTLRYNGNPLMLMHLGNVLGLPRSLNQNGRDTIPVVVLSAVERRMAFAVDELADEQEIVIKGLGKQLTRVGGIAGASVLGSGEVVLILNISDLIKLALRGERRPLLEKAAVEEGDVVAEGRPQQRILIVDDSITTRTLEKNILEAAGYAVQLATDGLEAWNAISSSELPDIIISDIAMPRMDGFGLAQRIKTDARTAHIPLILVTSLDSPEDKARGIEVGADAYIVKSSFDQNNLLETIEQLV